jgi:hypothetical protein
MANGSANHKESLDHPLASGCLFHLSIAFCCERHQVWYWFLSPGVTRANWAPVASHQEQALSGTDLSCSRRRSWQNRFRYPHLTD